MRKLTDTEKLIATRLKMEVTFLPGSYDKKFCNGLSTDAEYTDKQIEFMHKCFHRYRRQLKDYKEICYRLSMEK